MGFQTTELLSIHLNSDDIDHLIEALKADLFATKDANSIVPEDMGVAEPQTIKYCQKSERILAVLQKAKENCQSQ